jgi:hypothetical protein
MRTVSYTIWNCRTYQHLNEFTELNSLDLKENGIIPFWAKFWKKFLDANFANWREAA